MNLISQVLQYGIDHPALIAFVASEVLVLIPGLKSNSLLQLCWNLLKSAVDAISNKGK